MSGEIPPELGSLSNLKRLEFGNNAYSCGEQDCEPTSPSANRLNGEMPAELGDLDNLTGLYLHSNQLSGEIPPALGSLANLEQLYLSGNQSTGCVPAGLRDVPGNDFDILDLPFCRG